MCGTPSYLAPEVVSQQNDEGYDNLVDSWSVGVIVYAMLVPPPSINNSITDANAYYRIANASPFIEDEQCKSVKDRILKRRIVWEHLVEKYPTQDGTSFFFFSQVYEYLDLHSHL